MEMKKSDWKNLGGGLRLYIPSKTIYAVKAFRYLGIPNLFESLGQISEREARRKLPGVIEAWKKKCVEEGEKTIGETVPLFLKYETPKKRRVRTVENHQMIFGDILQFFGDLKWSEFNEEIYFDRIETVVKKEKALIFEQRKRERKGGVQRKTFDYLAVGLNMLAKYAYKKKFVSIQIKIPLTDEGGRTGRAIDHSTAQLLYSHMTEDAKDMYCLSYVNCMRKDEGMLLTWDRFDLSTGLITLRPEDVKTGSRTKRGRQIIVADWVRDRFVHRYMRQKAMLEKKKLPVSPWVFPSPRNPQKPQRSIKTAWQGAKRRAGIVGRLRWHDLRHSGISYLIHECHLDIVKVSEFVGTSVRTLQRVYLHTRPEQTREVGQAIRLE